MVKKLNENKAKILLLDIENSALVSHTWSRYKVDNVIHVQQESYILSFSYKWLGEKKAYVVALNDFPGYKPNTLNDKKLVKKIHDIMSDADIILGQNVKAFDLKKINSRFIYYDLPVIAPYKVIDTLLIARKYFAFSSNRLDDLGAYLGLGRKIKTGGYDLWLDCQSGKKEAWKKMKAYNLQDILLLEKIYYKLRAYDTSPPNIGMYVDGGTRCATCGSNHIQSRGVSRNKTTKYRRFFCCDCGSWGRDTKNIQVNKPILPI